MCGLTWCWCCLGQLADLEEIAAGGDLEGIQALLLQERLLKKLKEQQEQVMGVDLRGVGGGDPGAAAARKAAKETQGTAGTGNGGGSQGSGGRVKKLKEQ